MKLLDELNDRQREAVLATEGPLLILAGAGSGKTRVLTYRVAHLVLGCGVPPRAVLAFTFTNKAAGEMKDRLGYLLGGSPRDLWVGTFHATGVRILRQSGQAIGIDPGFTIYDVQDQESVLRQVLADLDLADRDWTPRGARAAVSAAKNALLSPAAFAAQADSLRAERVAKIYAAYQKRLRAAQALDFDDLIGEPIRLFEEHPAVRDAFAERFHYVLVDEYQDTNTAQVRLIGHLASGHRNLCVVGDDDQAIYGWRGADLRNILTFESLYPEAKVVRLEQNYRSTGNILAAANAVVRGNRARKEKTLWTERETGERVRFRFAVNEEEEAARVVEEATREIGRRGVSPAEVAVLYRTNAQSRALETAFRYAAIPYELVGGTAFYERREVKDLLAYLRLVVNDQDDVAFLRVVNVPRRGIGHTTVERLAEHASREGVSLLRSLDGLDRAPEFTAGVRAKLLAFRDLIGALRAEGEQPVPFLVEEVVTRTSFLEHLATDDPETAADRRENVGELLAGARVFADREPPGEAAAFLREVALLTDLDRVDEKAEKVRLMTIHNAKGLEFRVVLVPGCEEGLLPHASSREDDDDLEEERRLFYVAMTRAKDRVVLLAAGSRFRWGVGSAGVVSRFVEEIPDDLLDRDVPERRPVAPSRALRPPVRARGTSDLPAGPRRSLGTILHPTFGRGDVVGQEGAGPDARLTVVFGGNIRKKILARYAQWEESHVDF